jgi:hypothetical protein
MRVIHNRKFYTYSGGSFKVFNFLRFRRYAFRLKTLSFSQHFE